MDERKPLKTEEELDAKDKELVALAAKSLESADKVIAVFSEMRKEYQANGNRPLSPFDVYGSVEACDDVIRTVQQGKEETLVGLGYALGEFGWTVN